MIPKIIHYCWFSNGKAFPKDLKRNIASWKKMLPEYEFMLWDSDSFNLEEWPFAKEAFQKKKYAFASDVARLYAMYTYGGIYLDTDVQILKKFDDLLHLPYFAGLEHTGIMESAIIGTEKNADWMAKCLEYYDNKSFIKEDGSYDLRILPVILRIQLEKIREIEPMSFLEVNEVNDIIKDTSKFYLFPFEYFSPKDVESGQIHKTENTYTIHHFSGSWLPAFSIVRRKIKLMLGVNTINNLLKIKVISSFLGYLKKIEAKLDNK
ncbi:glycosyltransferase family 32 protein [Maribacter ulvicola]|uniref:Glycosyltransferase sugar-binding region containing DXD motif-containing protein n=1 Tax=Maribacter ulvicola TaxID=228959 RepID=A0A1N6VKM0_9FLAO|nr:glycosyltransferase [Maribacter ulvicola]SIQ78364.1 Glycosyltransferase sugar-binding region containing DXD motif-containing protein [Maribacter ulvicola]